MKKKNISKNLKKLDEKISEKICKWLIYAQNKKIL